MRILFVQLACIIQAKNYPGFIIRQICTCESIVSYLQTVYNEDNKNSRPVGGGVRCGMSTGEKFLIVLAFVLWSVAGFALMYIGMAAVCLITGRTTTADLLTLPMYISLAALLIFGVAGGAVLWASGKLGKTDHTAPQPVVVTGHRDVVVIRRGFVLTANILASAHAIFATLMSLGNVMPAMSSWYSLITGSMLMHAILLCIGVIIGWYGYAVKNRGIVLASAILYSVSAVVFWLYLIFLVLPIMFGFIGYARMRPVTISVPTTQEVIS